MVALAPSLSSTRPMDVSGALGRMAEGLATQFSHNSDGMRHIEGAVQKAAHAFSGVSGIGDMVSLVRMGVDVANKLIGPKDPVRESAELEKPKAEGPWGPRSALLDTLARDADKPVDARIREMQMRFGMLPAAVGISLSSALPTSALGDTHIDYTRQAGPDFNFSVSSAQMDRLEADGQCMIVDNPGMENGHTCFRGNDALNSGGFAMQSLEPSIMESPMNFVASGPAPRPFGM